jgi:hypothetical protein
MFFKSVIDVLQGVFYHFYRSLFAKKATDWTVIFVCVIFSSLIWLFNALGKNYTTRLDFKVVYQYDKSKYVCINKLPTYFSVVVYGKGWDLWRYKYFSDDSPIYINIESPLKNRWMLQKDVLAIVTEQNQYNFQINAIQLDTLYLHFDLISTKTLPLLIKNIPIAKGYGLVGKPKVIPDSITLEGPSSILAGILSPMIIDLSDENSQITGNYSMLKDVPYKENPLIRLSAEQIHITVEVVPYQSFDRKLKVYKHKNLSNFMLSDTIVTLTCYYEPRNKPDSTRDNIDVIASIAYLNEKDSTVQLKVRHSDHYIKDCALSPQFVKIKCKK